MKTALRFVSMTELSCSTIYFFLFQLFSRRCVLLCSAFVCQGFKEEFVLSAGKCCSRDTCYDGMSLHADGCADALEYWRGMLTFERKTYSKSSIYRQVGDKVSLGVIQGWRKFLEIPVKET